MARIAKSGLDYFPMDIDFFQDFRIRKLIKRQGGKAVTVYTLLLCLIYKNGYYMQWDNELPFICSESSGFDEAFISEVIKACLALGLFDKRMFDSDRILTSRGIQVRYCTIQRLNKRMGRIDKYSLLDAPAEEPEAQEKKKESPAHVPAPEPPAPPLPDTYPDAPPPATSEHDPRNSVWLTEFFADNHSENLQLLCKNFGLRHGEIDRLRSLAQAVVSEWELSHTPHRDYSDWSRHLIASMRIKNRDTSEIQQTTPPSSDYSFKGGFGGQDI